MFGNTRTGDSSTAIGQAPKVKDFIKENEGAGDGAQSRLEQVQPRLDHSEGAIAVMNLQPSCVRNLVEHMPCDISLELAEEFRQENQVWMGWNLPILPCQEYLTRWILDPAFSSMHYPYLHRDRLLNCMSVAQAWLWQNKHYQLAAILCAKPSARPRDQWTTSNCRPMSAAVEAKLALHYPYNRSTRARPTKSAKVEPHPAILGIKNIVTAFEGYKWDTLRDRQYLPLITGSSGSTTVTLPSDARDVIAEIVMYFNSFTPKHV